MSKPYGEVLDEMDHQAKYQSATVDTKREEELRIQALGAAISRRDWHATELAYATIRDKPRQDEQLRAALEGMLKLFGAPHREEYIDGGASYQLALDTVANARAALTVENR